MADTKLTALTATTSPASTDIVYVVVDPGTTPVSKKSTLANLRSAIGTVATDPIFDAAGDLAVGSGADTASKLAIGSAGRVLVSNPSAALAYVGGMQLISDTLLVGSAADITISSIPNTFRHLKLYLSGRGDTVASAVECDLQFNGDTGTNYAYQWLYGSGATPSASEGLSKGVLYLAIMSAASNTANFASSAEITIYDYAATTFFKTATCLNANMRANSTGSLVTLNSSGIWMSTSAITAIKIFPAAGNFIAGTRATLYGLSV